MREPERSAEFQAAREKARAALAEARTAFRQMLDLDPEMGHHDDVAELIDAVSLLRELHGEIKPEMEAFVLSWLLRNVGGVRSVRVGEMKYWGEKEKSTRCLDVGEAGMTMAHIRLERSLLVVAGGGDPDEFWPGVRDLFREVVSSGGLKEGACRELLGDDAEEALRADYQLDPSCIALLPEETPDAALARAVEAAREGAFLQHFEESWPDKVKGGEPKTKLGVGNLRFLFRRGGGTKKELEEMNRQRVASGVSA
jgi:hypothetical protein